MVGRKFLESLASEGKLTVAVGVGEDAQCIRDLKAFLTCSVALTAHAAVERPDLLEVRGEDLFVPRGEGLGHGSEVFVELIHVGHAGDGGTDVGPA